ncbi:MAG: MvaI/BcnI family restriction endonuclease [Candidatus Eisenbacteria bacterium]
MNELPTGAIEAVPTGKGGQPRFHARVHLEWLSDDGSLSRAPAAKLILYPQYPEIRLSGFLLGSPGAPSEILAKRAEGRALVLGVTSDGRIIGYAAGRSSDIERSLLAMSPAGELGIRELPLDPQAHADSRTCLIAEMSRIHSHGWHDSRKLTSSGILAPCESRHCGGYTLEAQLGIRPNGIAEPDYQGWEVKQFGVANFEKPYGVLTLMTPEPDGGAYKDQGVEAFIRRYGYADKSGIPDRLNFGGIHRFNQRCDLTGLTLKLEGFNPSTGKVVDAAGAITLVDERSNVAASWAFEKLLAHWRRKHGQALFATSRMRALPRRQYRYGPRVWLGIGTDFQRLLAAIANGTVYYDPGIKLTGASSSRPQTKRRSQFRVKFGQLDGLYERWEPVDLTS